MKKSFILTAFIFLTISCAQPEKKETTSSLIKEVPSLVVPTNTIDKSKLNFDKSISVWTLEGKAFSGYAVSYFQDSTMMEKFGILDGKKQNEAKDWFPDGHLQHFKNYHKGKLHGEKKTWSSESNHVLIAHLNYHLGKAHGAQKKWYSSGELFKKLNLSLGKEEGIQQAFRKNGTLYANYEARNGKIYGLNRAALCFGLEDEKIANEK